jgi:hypothetical protein
MPIRWSNSLIVLMWLATMTWLIVAKVVPPLRRGEPPNYRAIYGIGEKVEPVAWEISLHGKSLGWSVCTFAGASDMPRIHSRIHFDRIPLYELSPAWMKSLIRTAVSPMDDLPMDILSDVTIDSLGHLSSFMSKLHMEGMSTPLRVSGKVQGSVLKIKVESGGNVIPWDTYLPADALVTDELSPQSQLRGLRMGQEWTVPVYSTMRPPNHPIDILQAKVESHELMMWEGQAVGANIVVYRADSGSALSSTSEPRAKLWVRDDGAVLKQEVSVLGSLLVFTRLPNAQAVDLAKRSELEDVHFDHRRRFENLPASPAPTPSLESGPSEAPGS